MDDNDRVCERWEIDPFCPPSWRSHDARRILLGRRPIWARQPDDFVLACVAYLKGRRNPPFTCSRLSAIEAAHELAQRYDPLLWQVQAGILAGLSDEEIAGRCNLASETITWFERLFFHVRHCFGADDYIYTQVIGLRPLQGFANISVGQLWMALAYLGGSLILDALVAAFYSAWRPGEPATINVYFRKRSTATLGLQAAIAAYTAPVNGETDKEFVELYADLKRAESMPLQVGAAAKDDLKRRLIRLCQSAPLTTGKCRALRSERESVGEDRLSETAATLPGSPEALPETSALEIGGAK